MPEEHFEPCPFCGSDVVGINHTPNVGLATTQIYTMCFSCCAKGPVVVRTDEASVVVMLSADSQARRKWNRRMASV